MRPLGVFIILKQDKPEEQTKSGILITNVVDKPTTAVIIAIGDEVTKVKVSEKVLFKKYAPDEIKHNDEDYLIISQQDIIAVIE